MPTICFARQYVESGCLMSYSANFAELHRRAGYFIDRILKGAKPADLPVEQPTIFEAIVNLKTAKAIGVTIPESILLRADEVIR
jgi:putative ABC transport system substrate-binding protein